MKSKFKMFQNKEKQLCDKHKVALKLIGYDILMLSSSVELNILH